MPHERNRSDATATAAMLTPRGRGAVASLRYRGDVVGIDQANPPLFQAANGRPLADQPIGRIVFGRWGEANSEEVVVCRRDLRTTEIHCHGGDAAVRRILDDLELNGCCVKAWNEQLSAEQGLLEVECLEALSRVTTLRAADILLDQAQGTLRRALEKLPKCSEGLSEALDELLVWADFGKHLTRPWRVVLAGRPNVGKSSLINALVGYTRSIVYDQPGTTRDVVTADATFDGWPVQLADTAGIREAEGAIETAGIARARAHLAEADCRVIVLDTSQPRSSEDAELIAAWPDAFIVANKSDLADAWADSLPAEAMRVSSLTGAGVDELIGAIVGRLVPLKPNPGTAIPVSERQVKLLHDVRHAIGAGDVTTARRALADLLL